MPLTVVWEKAAVVMKDGTEKILFRGEDVPDEVTDFQRSVMVSIGAARDLGQTLATVQAAIDAERAQLEEPPAPPLYPAEVPPVRPADPRTNTDPAAVVPDPAAATPTPSTDTDTPTVSNAAQDVTDGSAPASDPADDLDKPRTNASKEEWETYAAAKGYMSREEAEAMTKTNLVAAVNRRENTGV